jgi:hypothetical protein
VTNTLIAIISCKKNAPKVQDQRETWIPRAIAAGYTVEVFDGERLGVPDDYLSLPLKTKALCKWALEQGWKRLLKLDDDAYLCIENFRVVEDDYAGLWIPRNDLGMFTLGIPMLPLGTTKYDYASGGAYWMSERSMRIIVETEITDWAEDRWVGQTLAAAGIVLKLLPDYLVHHNFFYRSDRPAMITQVKNLKHLHEKRG